MVTDVATEQLLIQLFSSTITSCLLSRSLHGDIAEDPRIFRRIIVTSSQSWSRDSGAPRRFTLKYLRRPSIS